MNYQKEMFCLYYSQSFNATEAAVKAGYSPKTARQQGSRLLTKVDVQEKLKKIFEETKSHIKISKDDLISELMEMLNSKPSDALEIKNNELKLKEAGNLESISYIKTTEGEKKRQIKCKFIKRIEVIHLLALLCGFLNDNTRPSHRNTALSILNRLKEYKSK